MVWADTFGSDVTYLFSFLEQESIARYAVVERESVDFEVLVFENQRGLDAADRVDVDVEIRVIDKEVDLSAQDWFEVSWNVEVDVTVTVVERQR